uniref:F-box domain-containing protein n=1 Tax=Tetradesmus obliquus TaxID=3088 RepID=A0A383VJK2_TETOB|eukprot:jgi/Sobl393_1/4267/SZX65708.1
MGKAKRQAQVCSSSSSSSSCDSSSSSDFSDDEHPSLDAGRYQAADLQQGLRTRQFRLWAVRELHQVLAQGWSSAGKKLQAAVLDDLMVAVQQPDSRPAVVEATAALLAVAKRVLPQQKRNQLVKQQRSAAVAASRASRKLADAGPDHECPAAAWCEADDDDDEPLVLLGDVPAEVVRGILQALDPLSLAAAACVCRAWQELATDSSLWQQHLQRIFPGASQQQQHRRRRQQQRQQQHLPGAATGTDSSRVAGMCSLHKQFASAAHRHPSALLPWRSCRVLVGGRLQWMAPGDAAGGAPAAVAKAARRGMILPGPVYVTTAQAVSWLMGSSWSQVFTAGSNSDSSSSSGSDGSSAAGSRSESDGEESHTLGGRRAAANALRLWAISKP